MEPMDVTMELNCRLEVVNRQGGVIGDLPWGSITVGFDTESTPSEASFIIVRASPNSTGTTYNLNGNIQHLSTEFLNQSQVTVWLKEPSCNIYITNADPNELTAFIVYLKEQLIKDSPGHVSMAALDQPSCQINLYLHGQEQYKLRMENIREMNINFNHFTNLEICNCILELAGDQVPIAGAIRKMKNLKTLRLEKIQLRSSTFLEIESKELKQLHLCHCETQLPIASLFKNDLCYKDSLVELYLDRNQLSEIPNGIFQFQNLQKLSLKDNLIAELPDKFANLPKLQELLLCYNHLTHLPPSIFEMQNLLVLLLNNNDITEQDKFANLSKLQVLSLCHNRLTHVPTSISQMQNMSELLLDNNHFTQLPDMFANLSKLQVLSLCNNQLRDLPPSIFQIQNLLKLSIDNNYITELPDMFDNLPKLQTLSLSHNQITHLPSSILALQNLSELHLSDNLIFELPNVINLPMLKTLLLCDNQLRSVPSCIFEMKNLSALSLSNNHLTELPDKFNNLPKLEFLSLENNQLQYLPPSICSLHLDFLVIEINEFNLEEIPPSVGSELIVHSLKELSYRTILNHKLRVKEGMLPEKFLKDLENHRQCVCGCKYVDEGKEVSFLCNLRDILNEFDYDDMDFNPRILIRGEMCNSLQSCYHGHFLSVN